MEFPRTHVRQRIYAAVEAAIKAVPDVGTVTLAAPFGDHPRQGSLVDIAFVEEDEPAKDGGAPGLPAHGTLKRPLMLGLHIKAQVPYAMTAVEFEGLVGDVERAMVHIEALKDVVDDIKIATTAWNYGQDNRKEQVSVLLIYRIQYNSPAADPGKAI